MKLSENIDTLRKKKGFSQEYLAEKIGVSRQTISNWCLGETAPNPEQLLLLSKTLEISVDELLGNELNFSSSINNTKSNTSILIGSILVCTSIAFIYSYTANRFNYDEIFLITLLGGVFGYGLSLIINSIIRKINTHN